jgi:hypothetical protein
MKVWHLGLIIILLGFGSCSAGIIGEATVKTEASGEITTTSQIVRNSDGGVHEKLFVSVVDSNEAKTFQFRDSLPNGLFNSRDLYAVAQANNGNTCTVKGAGYEFRFFSVVPLVTSIDCEAK